MLALIVGFTQSQAGRWMKMAWSLLLCKYLVHVIRCRFSHFFQVPKNPPSNTKMEDSEESTTTNSLNSWRTLVKEDSRTFVTETSLHGVKNVGAKNRSRVGRWVLYTLRVLYTLLHVRTTRSYRKVGRRILYTLLRIRTTRSYRKVGRRVLYTLLRVRTTRSYCRVVRRVLYTLLHVRTTRSYCTVGRQVL